MKTGNSTRIYVNKKDYQEMQDRLEIYRAVVTCITCNNGHKLSIPIREIEASYGIPLAYGIDNDSKTLELKVDINTVN